MAAGAAQSMADNVVPNTGSIPGARYLYFDVVLVLTSDADIDTAATANMASVLAIQDMYSGNETWRDLVLNDIIGGYAFVYTTNESGFL